MITATQGFLLVALSVYFGLSTGMFFALARGAYRGRDRALLAFIAAMYVMLIVTCVFAAQDIVKAN